MNYQEPSLFRWIRANIILYWKIIAALPIGYAALRRLYYLIGDTSDYTPMGYWLISLLGFAPDVVLYLLFIKYLGLVETPNNPESVVRFAVATTTGSAPSGSVREFAQAGAIRWFVCYLGVTFFSAIFGGFGYYISFSSFSSLLGGAISIACCSFVLKETRLVQQHDSHDGASRILGMTALYLSLLGIEHTSLSIMYGYDPVNPLFVLLCLALVVTVLWYEQRRYLLVQAVYHSNDKSHFIKPIDPLDPPQGLLPLAYWPTVSLDGILYRTDQSNPNDVPFRSNEVKVPLFIVPTQSEPFVGLLSRRIHGYIALLVVTLLFLSRYLVP